MKPVYVKLGALGDPAEYAARLAPAFRKAEWRWEARHGIGRRRRLIPSERRIRQEITDQLRLVVSGRDWSVSCGGLRVERTAEGAVELWADERLAAAMPEREAKL